MSHKVGGENFERAQSFQSLKSMWEAKAQESKKTELGTVSHGRVTPKQEMVDTVAVKEPRESEVLGELQPPLGQHPMEGEETSLTSPLPTPTVENLESGEEEVTPETRHEGTGVKERGEEVQTAKTESRVKVQEASPPKVQATAEETEHVAFNALERFVSIFSKSKAEKMQTKRLDGMVKEVGKQLAKKDTENAGKALSRLAKASPSRARKAIAAPNIDKNTIATALKLIDPQKYSESSEVLKSGLSEMLKREQSTFHVAYEFKDSEMKNGVNSPHFGKAPRTGLLPMDKLHQTVRRLPLLKSESISVGGAKVSWAEGKGNQEQNVEKLLTAINTAFPTGQTPEEIKNKAKFFAANTPDKEKSPSFEVLDQSGKRIDQGGKNEDILVLKFLTKEFASYATVPLYNTLASYCEKAGLAPGTLTMQVLGAQDQAESINIKKTEEGFTVTSKLAKLPLRHGEKIVGFIDATLTADVDSKTGDAKIKVEYSGLKFNDDVPLEVQQQFMEALNEPLIGAKVSEMKTSETEGLETVSEKPMETPSIKTLIAEQKDWTPRAIYENKPLFNAMKEFFSTKEQGFSDENFLYLETAIPAMEITDPAAFKMELQGIFDRFVKGGAEKELNIYEFRAGMQELLDNEPFTEEHMSLSHKKF